MKNPIAKIETGHGVIELELYPALAPNTVTSFIYLAKQGLFDSRRIMRIVPGFVIQPSYSSFEDERMDIDLAGEYMANGFDNKVPFKKGTVAMGGAGNVASGSCFFITLTDEAGERLAGKFAAFASVVSGYEEVERLEHVKTAPVESGMEGVVINAPVEDEYLVKVTVETWGVDYGAPVLLTKND